MATLGETADLVRSSREEEVKSGAAVDQPNANIATISTAEAQLAQTTNLTEQHPTEKVEEPATQPQWSFHTNVNPAETTEDMSSSTEPIALRNSSAWIRRVPVAARLDAGTDDACKEGGATCKIHAGITWSKPNETGPLGINGRHEDNIFESTKEGTGFSYTQCGECLAANMRKNKLAAIPMSNNGWKRKS